MKPSSVIVEEEWQRQARHERAIRTSAAAAGEGERARWGTVKAMLAWYWAMAPHMGSAPAIDYAREVVQGLRVDRDERIAWMARVRWSLEELARVQRSERGLELLWLHFRQPRPVGTRVDSDGRRTDVYGLPGVAIRELHLHAGGGRNACVAAFWEALVVVESLALERGWVEAKLERATRGGTVDGVYHRETPPVGVAG